MASFGNVAGDDPLGTAVQSRGQQARQQFALNQGWGHPNFGPLPDPKMDGLFQAMQEQGVDGIKAGGGPGPGPLVGVDRMPGEINPLKTTPATGLNQGPLPGYGASDQKNQIVNGLNKAYQPNYGAR